MLLAYVDDSGSHKGEQRLYLAGYILPIELWKSFGDAWRAALDEPPSLKSLHMTSSFQGWSREAREKKIQRMIDVVRFYRPPSIECSVCVDDFNQIVRPHAPHDLRHAYGVCFDGIIIKSAQFVESMGLAGPLEFVFDIQGNVGLDAALWYEPIKQMQVPQVRKILGGPPIFRDDEEVLPLQAADMLAWHRRLAGESTCSPEQRQVADSMVFNHAIVNLPREMLEQWAAAFSKVPGIAETQGKNASTKKVLTKIVRTVPPERLDAAMKKVERRARVLYWIRPVMHRLGLKKLWKKMGKTKIRIG